MATCPIYLDVDLAKRNANAKANAKAKVKVEAKAKAIANASVDYGVDRYEHIKQRLIPFIRGESLVTFNKSVGCVVACTISTEQQQTRTKREYGSVHSLTQYNADSQTQCKCSLMGMCKCIFECMCMCCFHDLHIGPPVKHLPGHELTGCRHSLTPIHIGIDIHTRIHIYIQHVRSPVLCAVTRSM